MASYKEKWVKEGVEKGLSLGVIIEQKIGIKQGIAIGVSMAAKAIKSTPNFLWRLIRGN